MYGLPNPAIVFSRATSVPSLAGLKFVVVGGTAGIGRALAQVPIQINPADSALASFRFDHHNHGVFNSGPPRAEHTSLLSAAPFGTTHL